MKIKFGKYGIAFYTNFLVKLGGITYGPFIFIRPKYIDDRGLLEHELVHTRQFWKLGNIFMTALEREVEAYKEQMKWYPQDTLDYFATRLSILYNFGITYDQALALLK